MAAPRITAAHVEQLAGLLGPRDRAVLETLDSVRVATAHQLTRLHFAGGTRQANARQAYRRLAQLVELRVLGELDRRVGGPTGGSTRAVFTLDVAGQRLASACGPAGGSRLRRPWTPGSAFLSHALDVTELLAGVTEEARSGPGELLAFHAERACWRRFTGLGGASVMLKPDCFVRFARADYEYACFVEVDRATAATTTVSRKLDVYRHYYQTSREQERLGLFPKVLVLVPDERRKEALVETAMRQPADAWPLFQIAPYAEAIPLLTGEAT